MADNKMPFVTSKALKRTPATKENKDRNIEKSKQKGRVT